MDYKRRDKKPFNSGQRSSTPERTGEKKGFAGLDPATLGLGGPDWLSPAPAPPDTSPASSVHADADGPAPVPSPWPESSAGAETPPARTLLEGMKVVCICKGIKKSVFWKVLDAGVRTKEEINHITGSGSGGCQGRRCGPRIIEMLRDLLPKTGA
jgi:bacterioferritin-associated ferredoxin